MTGRLQHWRLDPSVVFLNHGSFGACPARVLAAQQSLRDEMEAEPVAFLGMSLEARLDEARRRLADFLGAASDDLAFVPNATSAVNAVLRSLHLEPGDELLVTDHAYNACRAALDWVADRRGARTVVARIPFPIHSPDEAVAAVTAATGPRTRLALLDHVTSPTALLMPIERLVSALAELGVDSLVDGAHAPGMVPLHLDRLGAAYYAGNCHKWLCAPKGAGFLYVRPDRQAGIVPTVISHGANSLRTDRTRFRLTFDWTGTVDPTAFLAVPAAIDFMAGLAAGGWPEVMTANRALALEGRAAVLNAFGLDRPAPEDMIGSMAAVPLPGPGPPPGPRERVDPLQGALYEQHRIQIPLVPWGEGRLVRLSAQLYNRPGDYRALAEALVELLGVPEPDRRPGTSHS